MTESYRNNDLELQEAASSSDLLVEKMRQSDEINVVLEFEEVATIVSDSLPTAILNEQRFSQLYGRNGSNFNPVLFQPVDVVLVDTADGVRTLLLDGMHRSSGAVKFASYIRQAHPDFRFTARNLTSLYIQPDYGEQDGDIAGQPAISMADYLRLVVPPTMEQEKIAPQRVAAHLLVGWQGLVGREVAGHFSALSAFTILNYQSVDLKDRSAVAAAIDNAWFYNGASREDIITIRNGLFSMAEIINQTNLPPRRIADQVMRQIAKRADSIGGVDGAFVQLNGLLNHPVIVGKVMAHANSNPAHAARSMSALRERISNIVLDPMSANVFAAYFDVLLNPEINFDDMVSVISSFKPLEKYTELKSKQDSNSIRTAYCEQVGRDKLSATESDLLDRFRSAVNGDSEAVAQALESLRRIASAMEAASRLAMVVATRHGNPLFSRRSDINSRIESYFTKIYKADSLIAAGAVVHQLVAYHKECLSLLNEQNDDSDEIAPLASDMLPVAAARSAQRSRGNAPAVRLSRKKTTMEPERKLGRALAAALGALAADETIILDEKTWDQWDKLSAAMKDLRHRQA